MIIIKNLKDLEKKQLLIKSKKSTNYQHTYENLYAIHKSNKTAITFIDENLITNFTLKNNDCYECMLNIEPIVTDEINKEKLWHFINKIKNYLNKTLYFPLVYEDSIFYQLLNKDLYTYNRLYTSISDHTKINNIIDKITTSKRVYFSMRNVKKFESKLYIKSYTQKDVSEIIQKIELESWKHTAKQDMITKNEQFIYYTNLVKSGIASLIVAFDKMTDEFVAYRLDAIYNTKVHVLKNSFKEEYKKYSPGSYLLLYDLFYRYPKVSYVDLFGGPSLAKEMIETDRINRYDMLLGDEKIIKKIEDNRIKWDKLNYDNYLQGNSIKSVFNKKKNILAVTSVFGLGPVGKLSAIVDYSKYDFNWYAGGEEFDISIFSENVFKDTCFTMDKDILKDFLNKYDIKYALVVLKNKMARLLLELGVKVIYVDSLPFMWSTKDALEGKVPYNVDCYCAQQTIQLSDTSKEIFSHVKNLHWINPIVNVRVNTFNKVIVPNDFILINLGGLHSPTTNGYDYLDVVIKPIIEIYSNKKIIITTSSKAADEVKEILKLYKNVFVKTFKQEEFYEYIKNAQIFLSSPGLTTILEGMTLRDNIVFLPPQNISQFYNVLYGKTVFKYYKEITWSNPLLTLDGLKEDLKKDEHGVILEINKRISNLNNKKDIMELKKYMENILNNDYILNQQKKENKISGVEEVIADIYKVMEEK